MTLDQNWTLRVFSVLSIFTKEIVYNADDEDVELDENHIAMIGDCMIERMGHNNQGPRFYILVHQRTAQMLKLK